MEYLCTIAVLLTQIKLKIFLSLMKGSGAKSHFSFPSCWSKPICSNWKTIENFITMAAENGINMLLTPIFTPPLDTKVGGERLTAQLVDIELSDGKYSFDFKKLDKWVDICRKAGIEYFEMAHLFT